MSSQQPGAGRGLPRTGVWRVALVAMPSIGWTVIARATLLGVAVIAIPALVASALIDTGASGPLPWLFLTVAMAGFLAAGWVAGKAQQATPMLHGGVAALATYAIVQIGGAIRRIADGEDLEVIAVAVTALLALSCGVGGALAADWVRRRRQATSAPPAPLPQLGE